MQRGQRTAFLSLFEDEHTEVSEAAPERRGRSEILVQKRNELLAHRHYYYIKIVRRQYQDTLDILEDEFFISQRTIVDIFQKNTLLRELNAKKPEVTFFKKKYPWVVW